MAEYKDIHGTSIRNSAGNLAGAKTGELFFDSTNIDFKYQFPNIISSWRTTSNLNTGRFYTSGNGTTTSALVVSGENPGGDTLNVESFDGSTWTEIANVSQAVRGGASAGASNTSAIAFGGYRTSPAGNISNNEYWDGSSWTELADLNTARRYLAGSGEYPAALAYGGYVTTGVGNTETWNGTSWVETADLNTARNNMGSCGTGSNNALLSGPAQNESWNGTSWTEITDMNQDRGAQGAGTNTSAIFFGGVPASYHQRAERWNGTAWTEENDLNVGREGLAGSGSYPSALASAGSPAPPNSQSALTVAEVWSADIPIGAWTTVNSMNTARYNIGNVGVYNAALGFGGRAPSIANNEEWNGTSWTEAADLNTARHSFLGGAGNTESALAMGGENGGYTNKVEEWNGTSWSQITTINTSRGEGGGAGASAESALVYSGTSSSFTQMKTETESWNGSTWAEVADVNTARFQGDAGLGRTYTAALWIAGRNTPGSFLAITESWNGTSWTEVGDINSARINMGGQTGSSTSAFIAGGNPPYVGKTEEWNGTGWAETSDLNTARGSGAGGAAADITQGLIYGGYTGTAGTTATEEWNGSSKSTKVLTD